LLKSNAVSVDAGGNGTSSWSGRPPPYVYLHLDGGADYHDKLFYCDEQQRLLRGTPWLLMKTDSYLVPGLFIVPSLRGELERMFPEKDAVFHHLSRYLLHPANALWHAITPCSTTSPAPATSSAYRFACTTRRRRRCRRRCSTRSSPAHAGRSSSRSQPQGRRRTRRRRTRPCS
jgi:hypothetical protein